MTSDFVQFVDDEEESAEETALFCDEPIAEEDALFSDEPNSEEAELYSDEPIEPLERSAFELDYVGVKAPQFSFSRLKGADPLLGNGNCDTP